MPRNSSLNVWPPNNSCAIIRLSVAVLLASNLVAGYFVLRPVGGSPQELRQQVKDMTAQVRQQQGVLDRTRALAGKIQIWGGEGGKFTAKNFRARRPPVSPVVPAPNN